MIIKAFVLFILCNFLIIFQSGCFFISIDSPIERPYDPEKAGAEIIESYDLEEMINYKKYYSIRMAYYNNFYYFSSNKKIYVIRKDDFKINNIIDMSYINYDFCCLGLSVSNKILVSGERSINNNYEYFIFQMDLSGDNLKERDLSDDFGVSFFTGRLKYNIVNEIIMIKSGTKILSYNYNAMNDEYIKVNDWGNLYLFPEPPISFCIYGDDIWFALDPGMVTGAYIKKRNKNTPNDLLAEIDVSYLGTNNWIEDILYDGKYIWIIVEKDGKMQLLKLRPLREDLFNLEICNHPKMVGYSSGRIVFSFPENKLRRCRGDVSLQ